MLSLIRCSGRFNRKKKPPTFLAFGYIRHLNWKGYKTRDSDVFCSELAAASCTIQGRSHDSSFIGIEALCDFVPIRLSILVWDSHDLCRNYTLASDGLDGTLHHRHS